MLQTREFQCRGPGGTGPGPGSAQAPAVLSGVSGRVRRRCASGGRAQIWDDFGDAMGKDSRGGRISKIRSTLGGIRR